MRVFALLSKELADLRRNPAVFLPAVITGAISIILPFFVAIIVPYVTGERLSDSSDFRVAIDMYRSQAGSRRLDPEGAIQAWIFQQFLLLLVLTPIAGAMSMAAYTVIGEKQARSLEPLLATPISTFELLAAKVLGSLLPSVGLSVACFVVYLAAVAAVANPGVFLILFAPRSLAIVFLIGPLAALVALQLAVCVSSRVNDARSAQQMGALVILPLSGLLVAQLTGNVELTLPVIVLIVAVLLLLNAGLMRIGIALFDRESILTRWK
ncbi:MAG: ABC transporter permease [Vicinamibacterales bacterium]